jgi:hypothetical protein
VKPIAKAAANVVVRQSEGRVRSLVDSVQDGSTFDDWWSVPAGIVEQWWVEEVERPAERYAGWFLAVAVSVGWGGHARKSALRGGVGR